MRIPGKPLCRGNIKAEHSRKRARGVQRPCGGMSMAKEKEVVKQRGLDGKGDAGQRGVGKAGYFIDHG